MMIKRQTNISVSPSYQKKTLHIVTKFSAIPLGETRKISIITKESGRVDAACKVTVTPPKGDTYDVPVELKTEGYDCLFTPKVPGQHKVKIEYAAKDVPNSPFTVHVETIDVSKVLVKGLETRKS